MDDLVRQVMRTIDQMGTQEWGLALGAMVVFGFFCMRGFGSRSGY